LTALGGVLCVVGWFTGSGEVALGRQIGPANIGALGAVIVCGAGAGWLRHGYAILRQQRRLAIERLDQVVTFAAPSTPHHENDSVVFSPGRLRYHRPSCAFAGDRGWVEGSVARATTAGCTACEVCRP
jgi:hypothetical protein